MSLQFVPDRIVITTQGLSHEQASHLTGGKRGTDPDSTPFGVTVWSTPIPSDIATTMVAHAVQWLSNATRQGLEATLEDIQRALMSTTPVPLAAITEQPGLPPRPEAEPSDDSDSFDGRFPSEGMYEGESFSNDPPALYPDNPPDECDPPDRSDDPAP